MEFRNHLIGLVVGLCAVSTAAFAQGADAPLCPPQSVQLSPILGTHQIPPYPVLSTLLGEQGDTILQVTIRPDGTVSDAAVVSSSGSSRLDEAAASYVKQNWRWQVVERNCGPSSVATKVDVVWRMNQPPPIPTSTIDVMLEPSDYPPDVRPSAASITVVGILLSDRGGAETVNVIQTSGNPSLDKKSLDLVRTRFQWTPPQMSGQPIKSTIVLALHWPAPSNVH
jgi:TonB family protein